MTHNQAQYAAQCLENSMTRAPCAKEDKKMICGVLFSLVNNGPRRGQISWPSVLLPGTHGRGDLEPAEVRVCGSYACHKDPPLILIPLGEWPSWEKLPNAWTPQGCYLFGCDVPHSSTPGEPRPAKCAPIFYYDMGQLLFSRQAYLCYVCSDLTLADTTPPFPTYAARARRRL